MQLLGTIVFIILFFSNTSSTSGSIGVHEKHPKLQAHTDQEMKAGNEFIELKEG